MSVCDVELSSHVDGIEHSIDVGIVMYLFNGLVNSYIVVGRTNLVFIELIDSVQAVGLLLK